jgi:hypothetical protein
VTAVQYEPSNAELGRSLTRIEGKLDKVTEDHEGRLRRVERTLYVTLGLAGAGVTSGVGSFIAALFGVGP